MTGFLNKRSSGLLLHISSLPSGSGTGDFGRAAYKFIDFLEKSRQSYWQVLPLNPTTALKAYSPYAPLSAFAGNTLFINHRILYEDNLIKKEDTGQAALADFKLAGKIRGKLLGIAYEKFKSGTNASLKNEFEAFCLNNRKWLDDYAAFKVFHDFFFKEYKKPGWAYWPQPLRKRNAGEMKAVSENLSDEISKEKFCQFIFMQQWAKLRKYASEKNIRIIGDVPIYMDYDSSDVWANQELFKLDRRKYPAYVGGVPPDYFSRTGQLWNNPVYDWNELKRTGFTWWIDRIVHNLGLFDLVRLDHFRGFVSYWEVPAGEKTARNGRWVNACAKPFFNKLAAKIPGIPIIAENLGVITPDVVKIMKEFKFPGIAILQFAFGKDFPESEHLPVKYSRDTVVYTGTHDNNTTRGWFDNDTKPYEKKNISQYFRQDINPADICSAMIELAMKSAAVLSIIPVQDILCLGPESRMNHPSTVRKNWKWQLSSGEFDRLCSDSCTAPLAEITAKYKR